MEDFLYRVDISYKEAYILTKLGAMVFDNENGIEQNKKLTIPQMLWKLKIIYPAINNLKKNKRSKIILRELLPLDTIPEIGEYSIEKKIEIEEEYYGMAITLHPLMLYSKEIKMHNCISSSNFGKYKGRIINCVGWLTALKRVLSSKGKYMLFVSFEDLDGFYETTFFSGVYDRYGVVLTNRGPYLIKGEVCDDFGFISINVLSIRHL